MVQKKDKKQLSTFKVVFRSARLRSKAHTKPCQNIPPYCGGLILVKFMMNHYIEPSPLNTKRGRNLLDSIGIVYPLAAVNK